MPAPERLYQVMAEGLATDFPAPNSLDAIPNNLPVSPSALVGRAEELAQLGRILERRDGTPVHPDGAGRHRQDAAGGRGGVQRARALRRRRHLRRSRARARGHDRPCRDRPRDEPRRSRRSRPPNGRGRAPAAATDAPGARQLRAGHGGRRRRRRAHPPMPEAHRPRHQPRGAAGPRRTAPPGPAALLADRLARRDELSRRRALRRARARSATELRHGRRDGRDRRRDLRAARRAPARDRTRRRTAAAVLAGRASRPSPERARCPPRRRARPARPPANAARHDRLELRPARRRRAGAVQGPRGVPVGADRGVEQVCGEIDALAGLDVVDGLELARRQEPAADGRERPAPAALDARDDP